MTPSAKRLPRSKKILITMAPLLLLAVVGAYVWLRVLPLRVERLYGQATEQYGAGDYMGAAATLRRAYKWDPWAVRVNLLLGWSYWRLGDANQAEFYFARAHHLEPNSEEAKVGLAFASLARQHLSQALPLLRELYQRHPSDDELASGLAQAYLQSGENVEAARIYQRWLDRDPANQKARQALLDLYGYADYRSGVQVEVTSKLRPAQTEMYFRTQGEHFQALANSEWKDVYLLGLNLGPARPQEFPSTAPREFSVYQTWLQQIGAMHANTVRVYTILPPAFYQALRVYNETATRPLWLIQEVWIEDGVQDLYDPENEQQFRRELQSTIDLLHGQADLNYRRGHNYGIYTADVSRWVLALGVGREVEPKLVLHTNAKHGSETSYQGRYVSLVQGSPSETWFARMCDAAAAYEMEKYNAQRPLTVVNWPPLDPITHQTEANYADEMQFRKKLGEAVPSELPANINDADAVSVDIKKFKTELPFQAGLFALFHVYQHWPDFLLHEPGYAAAKDTQGPNRYLGYLLELKAAYPGMPLLIGEYGLSTSVVPAHVHPQGWHNGGLTEKQQAELLVRFTKNIHEIGCAGGIVFAWQDEWWKHVHDSFTADFERPWDRNPLWNNQLDPEKHFGIVGYEPAEKVPLLRGDPADWAGATQLPTTGSTSGQLRAAYATSDFTYLYVRLDLAQGPIDWATTNYWIALNTLPGESGSRQLPGIGVRLESGANFLIQLSGPSSSRLLIAENYNPNRPFPVVGRAGKSRIWRKQGMSLVLANSARFEDMVIEANPLRFARDGTEFPAITYDRSPLAFGTADRSSPQFSSNALWNAHPKRGMIELRIPWGLLLMSDPSQRDAFAGTDQQWVPVSKRTQGISIAAFEIGVGKTNGREQKTVTSSLPPLQDGHVAGTLLYTWEPWNQVHFHPYFKQSYSDLQKVFAQLSGSAPTSQSTQDSQKRHAR